MAAASFDEAFVERVVLALREAGLEAVIVGGVAAVLHGAPVTTQDVDLLVRRTAMNEEKITEFRRILGGLGRVKLGEDVDSLVGAEGTVDLIFDTLPPDQSFASVRSRAIDIDIAGFVVKVAALADIIASKKAVRRPKDLAVLPTLEETLRVKDVLGR